MSETNQGVSVVISTYNRPKLLLRALQSLERQTVLPLEVVVVGDNCSDTTSENLRFHRGRLCIKYVNLAFRCGEQAIPNKVGTEIAKGKYVAFLNHDDLWLPDHLETALESMAQSQSNWYAGKAAVFRSPILRDGMLVPTETTPSPKTLDAAYRGTDYYFEPVSSWLIPRGSLLSTNWRAASCTFRTPVSDLALRLSRKIGHPASSESVTTLKVMGPGMHDYSGESEVSLQITKLFSIGGSNWSKGVSTHADVAKFRTQTRASTVTGIQNKIYKALSGGTALWVFKVTGFDALGRYSSYTSGGNRALFSKLLNKRTGEVFSQDVKKIRRIVSSELAVQHFCQNH